MKKHSCGDCKWYSGFLAWCDNPKTAIGRSSTLGPVAGDCRESNANGDCQHYSRKWWKFGRPK